MNKQEAAQLKEDIERRKRVMALINKVNKESKANVLALANDVPNVYHYRTPTGIMELDVQLAGGFPNGGMSVLAGPESSGKTTMMYLAMAMHQRIFGNSSILGLACVEGLPDYFYMRDCGMKVEIPDEVIDQKQEEREFRGLPLYTKEELKGFKEKVGELVIIRGSTTEEILQRTLFCYESTDFGIVGVDSINANVSEAEDKTKDGLEGRPQQSADALALTRFCNRVHRASRGLEGQNRSTLFLIAQVRANRDRANAPSAMQKYIRQYNLTLPWAVRHAMLVCLLVMSGEKIKETTKSGTEEKGTQLGKYIRWETIKGKAGTWDGLKGDVEFTYSEKVDVYRTVLVAGMATGVLKEGAKGAVTIMRAGTTQPLFEPVKGGMEELVALMKKDIDFELRVRHEILAANGKSCGYR